MKKYLFLIPACLLLTACPWDKTPLCEAQKSVADKFAGSVAGMFGCAKQDIIAEDFNKALEPLKMCEAQSVGGVLADFVCPVMVKYAVSQGLNVLPSTWECTGGTATDALEDKLTVLCKSIPF
jgi:hypothetical protein